MDKNKLKKTSIEVFIAVILFTGLMIIGGCITSTAKVDPTPRERVAAELAQVMELKAQTIVERAQVEELKVQSEYLKRIAFALEKIANNSVH